MGAPKNLAQLDGKGYHGRMRLSPWTIVCLIGFPLYAIVGRLHADDGGRQIAYYGVSVLLFAGAIVGLVRGRRAKPPPT